MTEILNQWNVLIVEDEEDSAEVIARVFKYHKIKHRVANSAEDAMIFIETEQPTGMIIDLALPGRDGWWLISQIRANPATAHIRAVASTSFHSLNMAQEAIQAGFDAYLPKPIEAIHLVEELRRIFTPA